MTGIGIGNPATPGLVLPADPVLPGEIYLITIPSAHAVGSEQLGTRPWVIVSRETLNRGRIVSGIPLTTTGADGTGHPAHRIVIPIAEIVPDVTYKDAIQNSVALTDQLRVLDKRRLGPKMGKLSDTALAAIGLGLLYLFNL